MAYLKFILASNIKNRRKTQGLTQENLAEMVNTASTYIAMIESGKRTPSFKMIERIAEVLKIDASELFSAKEYPLESSTELRNKLLNQFDKFLRATINETKGKADYVVS
jgi:transcriptional regulator with XRE-family HTH domain